MGKQVQVKQPYSRLWLYDGGVFDADQTATLTDAEYTALGTVGQGRVTLLGSVADPVRGGGTGTTTPTVSGAAIDPAGAKTVDFIGGTPLAGMSYVGYVVGDTLVDNERLYVLTSKGTGAGPGNHVYWAAPSGDWTAVMKGAQSAPGGAAMWGLMALDDSGNGVGGGPYNSAGGGYDQLLCGIANGYYAGTAVSAAWPPTTANSLGAPTWIRLRKSGTNYYLSVSVDGEKWGPETAAKTGPATATRLAVGGWFGTTAKFMVEYLDVR